MLHENSIIVSFGEKGWGDDHGVKNNDGKEKK